MENNHSPLSAFVERMAKMLRSSARKKAPRQKKQPLSSANKIEQFARFLKKHRDD